ncbi:putative lipoprotein [Burkholderia pseudomallei S13]|nr:putative lipoprotein [Burkholderia pseudomallei S13]
MYSRSFDTAPARGCAARAAFTASISAAIVACASPTIVRFARLAIGALPSRFTAITWRQSLIPCRC